MEEKPRSMQRFAFLAPALVIKSEHLTRNDTKKIKENLSLKMASIAFVVACLVFVICFATVIYRGIMSNWNSAATYGVASSIGLAVSIGGCLITIVSLLIYRKVKSKKVSHFMPRFALDVLFLSLLFYFACCFVADAQMGFLTEAETLTPSILVIFVLILLQPAFWIEMTILDALTAITVLVVSVVCRATLNTGPIFYYVLVAAVFPGTAHVVVSTLFYAETQNYCQSIANDRLHDKVLYDELTHCKSRVALKEFLDERPKRWVTHKTDVLLVMFDIDNFKQYNDQFSHISGDHCLQRVCDAIRLAFPTSDLDFFRYGGEEFLLFFELNEENHPQKIMEIARNAVKEIRLLAPEGAPKEVVTISLGGTIIHPSENFSFDKELELVDTYLYQAKSSGKDVSVLDGALVK